MDYSDILNLYIIEFMASVPPLKLTATEEVSHVYHIYFSVPDHPLRELYFEHSSQRFKNLPFKDKYFHLVEIVDTQTNLLRYQFVDCIDYPWAYMRPGEYGHTVIRLHDIMSKEDFILLLEYKSPKEFSDFLEKLEEIRNAKTMADSFINLCKQIIGYFKKK